MIKMFSSPGTKETDQSWRLHNNQDSQVGGLVQPVSLVAYHTAVSVTGSLNTFAGAASWAAEDQQGVTQFPPGQKKCVSFHRLGKERRQINVN